MLPGYITSPFEIRSDWSAPGRSRTCTAVAGGLQPLGLANAQPTRVLLSSSTGGSRTHRHQGLNLAALPVCVPCQELGWRLETVGRHELNASSSLRPTASSLFSSPGGIRTHDHLLVREQPSPLGHRTIRQAVGLRPEAVGRREFNVSSSLQPDSSGRRGTRTPKRLAPSPVFKTGSSSGRMPSVESRERLDLPRSSHCSAFRFPVSAFVRLRRQESNLRRDGSEPPARASTGPAALSDARPQTPGARIDAQGVLQCGPDACCLQPVIRTTSCEASAAS